MRLRAPAKINLSFRIHALRADGFHEIETLMAPISLADELTIAYAGDTDCIELTCDDPSVPAGEDNLVIRAARLFFEHTSLKAGLRIDLQKRIPHGAGLGGGSSDAAITLIGLNELLEVGIGPGGLAQLAAEIGSDVPFFIYQSAALCCGRGEMVKPSTLRGTLQLLLLKPSFGVPTPWAYSRWKVSRELPEMNYMPQVFHGITFFNDLERPVFEKHLFLARMKMWLITQPEVGAALLSGSGSTIFAVLREGSEAELIAARAKLELDPELWTCECSTVSGR